MNIITSVTNGCKKLSGCCKAPLVITYNPHSINPCEVCTSCGCKCYSVIYVTTKIISGDGKTVKGYFDEDY